MSDPELLIVFNGQKELLQSQNLIFHVKWASKLLLLIVALVPATFGCVGEGLWIPPQQWPGGGYRSVCRGEGRGKEERHTAELRWYSNGLSMGMWFPECLPLFLAEDVRANESWKPSSASLDIFCLRLPALLKEKWLPHHCPISQQLFGNLPLTSTLQLACTLSTDHFLFLNPYAPNGSIFRIYEVSDVLLRTEYG